MNRLKTYFSFDYCRVYASIMVIAIHTSPFSSIDPTLEFLVTHVVCRIAVPFFFMLTGYFVLSPYRHSMLLQPPKLKPFLLKTAIIYLAAICSYLPINFYSGSFQNATVLSVLSDLLFNGTMYHLWYLPASMIGTLLVYGMMRTFKKDAMIFGLAFALYLLGLMGDSYYQLGIRLPYLRSLYDAFFSVFEYTRNGLFYAPVFLIMGVFAGAKNKSLPYFSDGSGFVISLALLCGEGMLLYRFHIQRHDSMLLFLVPCVFFLFQLLIKVKGEGNKKQRQMSMLLYLLHPMVIVAVLHVSKLARIQAFLIKHSFLFFVSVALFSFAAAYIILFLFSLKENAANSRTRAWIEIDLGNLRHNVAALTSVIPAKCSIMGVVKADAYGHGMKIIAKELSCCGLSNFAVATIDEAITLRKCGIRGNILILGVTQPADFKKLVKYKLTQTVADAVYAERLSKGAKQIQVHLKIDTGMHRLGFAYEDKASLERIFYLKNLVIKGTYTHLCCADSLNDGDVKFSKLQIMRFYETTEHLLNKGFDIGKLHIQSSYGILNYPSLSCDFARIGIALYGVLSSMVETVLSPDLHPVLSLKAKIIQIKELEAGEFVGYSRFYSVIEKMRIAAVSIGYADGLPRNYSEGGGCVLLRGRRAPIVGRICMDMMMIDITDIHDAGIGDIVTVIGADGEEKIGSAEVAQKCATISNELLSRLASRLPRIVK